MQHMVNHFILNSDRVKRYIGTLPVFVLLRVIRGKQTTEKEGILCNIRFSQLEKIKKDANAN